MRRRVVITGMGVINPMGHSVEEMWQAMKNCESGVARTSIFDASNFPSKIAAEIKNWDISMAGQDPQTWKHAGRHTRVDAVRHELVTLLLCLDDGSSVNTGSARKGRLTPSCQTDV